MEDRFRARRRCITNGTQPPGEVAPESCGQGPPAADPARWASRLYDRREELARPDSPVRVTR